MRRREFITMLGGAAATWPFAARAQQPAMPVIGYLSTRSPGDSAYIVGAFRKGLHEVGYTEGHNVAIEFRFAEGHHDRLRALTADLVRRQVNVIVATGGTASAVAAQPIVAAAIPMVFAMGGDPVKLGIVDGLARPGGNVTGISFLVSEMAAKHVQLLNELAPKTAVVGFLANPNNPNLASATTEARKAADMLSHKLVVVNAGAEGDFEPAFTTLVQQRVESLLVEVDPFFTDQRARITALAARHRLAVDLRFAGIRRCRRLDELWNQHHRRQSPARRLYWEGSQRHQTSRAAGHAIDHIRAGDQPQGRQGARPRGAHLDPLARADEVIE